MRPTSLVASFGLGTGHHRVAETLRRNLEARGHQASVSRLEDWVPREYDWLFRKGYLTLVMKFPRGWDFLYSSPYFASRGRLASAPLAGRAVRRFERESEGADLVVATQINAMEIAADLKATGRAGFRLAVVLTDYDGYPLWVRPEVDLYLLPHEDLAVAFRARGVPEDRLAVTGIPIAPGFEDMVPDRTALMELGLDAELPTALVVGGGVGAGPLREAVQAALGLPRWNVILVCGLNETLRRSMIPDAQAHPERLRVLGYRTDLPQLLAAADVLITKGGGLTLTEALAAGKRAVVLPSLPGQERANIAFMETRSWITVCPDVGGISRYMEAALAAGPGPRPLPPRASETATALLDGLARRMGSGGGGRGLGDLRRV
ncbi:MAG: MGDG synthase family glycosyltransferase [Acidobacteriota bacterium]